MRNFSGEWNLTVVTACEFLQAIDNLSSSVSLTGSDWDEMKTHPFQQQQRDLFYCLFHLQTIRSHRRQKNPCWADNSIQKESACNGNL
jgi:hypothetical protein